MQNWEIHAKPEPIMSLKVGNKVSLKSGGPTMTILANNHTLFYFKNSKKWECAWFVGMDINYGIFHELALTKEDPML